jgi:hypothetical protein
MTNVDHPHGLNAVMSRFHDTPRMTKYFANVTTAVFRGDVVKQATNGRVSRCTATAGNDNIIGVAANYSAAGTTPAKEIWVYDDMDTVFEIQNDITTDPGLTTARGHLHANANLITGNGSTASGQSGMEIDTSSITTAGTTAALKIVGFYNIAGNDISLAHARYLVVLNKHLKEKGVAI